MTDTSIYEVVGPGPLRQGEIISGVVQTFLDPESIFTDEGFRFVTTSHPFSIVITQDCDLDWDYKFRNPDEFPEHTVSEDKAIHNLLLCMAFTAEEIRNDRKARAINSDLWKLIRQNKIERYQFLEQVSPTDDAKGDGLPELTVDFKHYFSIRADELYLRIKSNEAMRRCKLKTPYMEHFIKRLYFYQGRVALPREHDSI